MIAPARIGHHYDGIITGDRVHLGDVYHHEPSPEERVFKSVLESVEYAGMHDRRDVLTEAHEGTFDWAYLEGETQFVEKRDEHGKTERDQFRTVDKACQSRTRIFSYHKGFGSTSHRTQGMSVLLIRKPAFHNSKPPNPIPLPNPLNHQPSLPHNLSKPLRRPLLPPNTQHKHILEPHQTA